MEFPKHIVAAMAELKKINNQPMRWAELFLLPNQVMRLDHGNKLSNGEKERTIESITYSLNKNKEVEVSRTFYT